MNRIHISTALVAAVLGIVAVAPKSAADEWDKKTIVRISEPMEVPGVTLEPGTYVFKLADSSSDRHIVVIQNERMNHTYATILAIPNYRLQPTSKSAFLFWETPAGQPRALRAWFYPADNFGQEFRYPKGRFTQVSQVTHQETAPPPPPAAEPTAPVQEQQEITQNTPPAPEPTPVPEAAPAPPPAPEPATTVAENNTPRVLPQTAGNIPLLAGIGFLSAGLALVLGAFVKRMG